MLFTPARAKHFKILTPWTRVTNGDAYMFDGKKYVLLECGVYFRSIDQFFEFCAGKIHRLKSFVFWTEMLNSDLFKAILMMCVFISFCPIRVANFILTDKITLFYSSDGRAGKFKHKGVVSSLKITDYDSKTGQITPGKNEYYRTTSFKAVIDALNHALGMDVMRIVESSKHYVYSIKPDTRRGLFAKDTYICCSKFVPISLEYESPIERLPFDSI